MQEDAAREASAASEASVLAALKLRALGQLGRGSVSSSAGRGGDSQRFSQIVAPSTPSAAGTLLKKAGIQASGVQKRVQQRQRQQGQLQGQQQAGLDFKVGQGVDEGGNRSTRSLTGLRSGSNILLVGSYESPAAVGKRGKIADVFDTAGELGGSALSRSTSQPDFLHNADGLADDPGSIFDRPGFGSVAFRCGSQRSRWQTLNV